MEHGYIGVRLDNVNTKGTDKAVSPRCPYLGGSIVVCHYTAQFIRTRFTVQIGYKYLKRNAVVHLVPVE